MTTKIQKSIAILGALLASCLVTRNLVAQEAAVDAPKEQSPTGGLGIDFPTKYFFRGLVQEDQGFIAQPYFDIGYSLAQSTGPINSVDLVFGQWNSLHDGPSGTGGSGTSMWYESDFYAGLSFTIAENWTGDATYIVYNSPNGSFSTVEEFDFGAAFDDSSLWGVDSFQGLQPHVVFAWEITGEADGGNNLGTYMEVGIEPSWTVLDRDKFNITASLPVVIGLSLGDYYQDAAGNDDSLGFLDIGIAFSAPLAFVPTRFGPWEVTAGLHYLFLGDTTKAVNGNDDSEIIFSIGFSSSF